MRLDGIETRVVIPLRTAASFAVRTTNLNPVLVIEGRTLVLDTAAMGAVPLADLRRPVTNATPARLEIQDALDTLFGSS